MRGLARPKTLWTGMWLGIRSGVRSGVRRWVRSGERRRVGGGRAWVHGDASEGLSTAFVTDVEGNLSFFEAYVNDVSSALDFEQEEIAVPLGTGGVGRYGQRLRLRDGWRFVFGGDAIDRGPGDLRVMSLLLDLASRYPERVHFLIGNRDANKVRLTSELGEEELARPLSEIAPPYWIPKGVRPTLSEYLAREQYDERVAAHRELCHSREFRLQFMLQKTMGCPETFEHRRTELGLLTGRLRGDVGDAEVAASFMGFVAPPGGMLNRYLAHAQVALLVGPTLFVHGAVSGAGAGFVPRDVRAACCADPPHVSNLDTTPDEARHQTPLRAWVDGLNAFTERERQEWEAQPEWDTTRSQRGGEGLMAYANFTGMRGRTVVYQSWLRGGNPVPVDGDVVRYLTEGGVRNVVSGHQPFGDQAMVLRTGGVNVVSADTSYSDPASPDNRGVAIAEVVVPPSSSSPSSPAVLPIVRGRTREGVQYEVQLGQGEGEVVGRPCVLPSWCPQEGGEREGEDEGSYYWVAPQTERAESEGGARGRQMLVRRGVGFDIDERWVSSDEVVFPDLHSPPQT